MQFLLKAVLMKMQLPYPVIRTTHILEFSIQALHGVFRCLGMPTILCFCHDQACTLRKLLWSPSLMMMSDYELQQVNICEICSSLIWPFALRAALRQQDHKQGHSDHLSLSAVDEYQYCSLLPGKSECHGPSHSQMEGRGGQGSNSEINVQKPSWVTAH